MANQKTAAIQDPFTATTANAQWTVTQLGSATFSFTSTGASCVFPGTTSSSTDGDLAYASGQVLDITGSFVRLNVTSVSGAGATHTDNVLRIRQNASNYVTIFYEAGTLFFSQVVASSQTNNASVAYNATNHAWWQIREKGGTTYWETSSDGVTWTQQFATANPVTLTSVDILIGGLCFGADTSPANFTFRFLNYPLPGTTTSTSSTSISSTSTSISSTSTSISSTSTSISSTSTSLSTSSTSTSYSITTFSTSSTSTSISSTSISSTSSSTSISSTSSSISSTSTSSTSTSSTSSSTSISSTSSSISSTSSSYSSTSSSVSSTSFSSTSSSSSTSTTTLPPLYLDYTYQDQAPQSIVKQFNWRSASTWLCPAGVTSVLAEVWGGGGGGGGADLSAIAATGGGGGGGGYSNNTITVTPGTSYTVSVGVPGRGGTGSAGSGGALAGGNGGDTSFVNTSTLLAKGGQGGQPGNNSGQGTGGAGGASASGAGTVTTSGGAGTAGNSNGVGGPGGGSGSQSGDGNTGVSGTNSNPPGGSPLGGLGGKTRGGGSPPGGGGGGADESGNGGSGAGGLVQLTYTIPSPQSNTTDMVNSFNAPNYANVLGDDGDYFIQNGSGKVLAMMKRTNTGNTNAIIVTWRGRSVLAPSISPILLQVYNVQTATWETWASNTTMPADTDFTLSVTITNNINYYYDSNNVATARICQTVV